jgi:3-hydroxyacyl-CoA dehydrogenase
MSWHPPTIGSRPVVVLGAGVLGRRIACSYVAAGYNVNIRDPFPEARQAAVEFIDAHKEEFATFAKPSKQGQFGSYTAHDSIESAVKDAWLVIEAVPEKLELKIDTFELLDRYAPEDCILGSNSSSYRSSLMLDKVSTERRKLVCNIHYTMPPQVRTVELMTDGVTEEAIFPFLTEVLEGCGMLPATSRKESTG